MGTKVITRGCWKTVEPEEGFVVFDYTDTFSASEYETIKLGLLPEAMEDKWFIYFEPPTLYFHRSWTGDLIYRVTLDCEHEDISVARAELSRKYSNNPVHETMMPWVMRGVLLGQDVNFPDD